MKLLLPALIVLPSVLAQYGNSNPSTSASVSSAAPATATSSSSSSVQTVMVGNGGFTFSPNSLTVAPGKSVVFQFYPGGHSVVQSSFDKPCTPLNDTSFSSGTVNSASGPASQVFTVPVNSTDPIWFYCAQVGHCQGGMVGVINPPSSGQTLDMYKSAAASAGASTKPAGVQGGTLGAPSSAAASGGSSGSGTSASASPSGNDALALRFTAGSLVTALAAVLFAFMM